MQAVTRNPIADPSILGVNTGAALFVVAGLAFWNISTAGQYIGFAIVGAILTAIFVYGIGSMGPAGATPLKLVLAGAATSAALSSVISMIILPRSNILDQFRFWQLEQHISVFPLFSVWGNPRCAFSFGIECARPWG